jgi:hypothetical protein
MLFRCDTAIAEGPKRNGSLLAVMGLIRETDFVSRVALECRSQPVDQRDPAAFMSSALRRTDRLPPLLRISLRRSRPGREIWRIIGSATPKRARAPMTIWLPQRLCHRWRSNRWSAGLADDAGRAS